MSDNELPVRVKRSLELTISHPGWWVVTLFTTASSSTALSSSSSLPSTLPGTGMSSPPSWT